MSNYLKKLIINLEINEIAIAMIKFNKNQCQVSKYLGINRATLRDRLFKYGDEIYAFVNNTKNIKAYRP